MGFYFYDDITYAGFAVDLIQGNFQVNEDHFTSRWGIVWLTALVYKIVGISEWSTTLPPLIATLIAINGIYFGLRWKSQTLALGSSLILGLDFYTLFFTNKLFPDSLVACCLAISLLILFRIRYANTEYPLLWAGCFVACIFLAWVAKVTAIFSFPFFLLLLLSDLLQRNRQRFWIGVLSISILLVTCYLFWYQIKFGDPFFRFTSIVDAHYISHESYHDKGFLAIVKRITYQPVMMLINGSMIIVVGLSLPSWLNINWRTFWKLPNGETFWFAASWMMFLAYWLMTTSWNYYNPLPLTARHALMIIPPFAILGAYQYYRFEEKSKLARYYAIIFGLVTIISWLNGLGKISYIYLALTIVFAIAGFWLHQLAEGKVVLAMIIGLLLVHPVYSMLKPGEANYFSTKTIIHKYLTGNTQPTLVVADEMIRHGSPLFYNFQNSQVRYINFEQASLEAMVSYDSLFLIENQQHLEFQKYLGYQSFMEALKKAGYKLEALYREEGVIFYKITKPV